jgi:undecaprenyl-diphosphatase
MRLPPEYDLQIAAYLGKFLGRHPLFDLTVQSGIGHRILGGFWYAAALFYFWATGATDGKVRTRVLTTFAGVAITIGLSLIAARLIRWPPPIQQGWSGEFPDYLTGNFNTSSFPSLSTAMYTSVALGVYSLNRLTGRTLLVGIPILVALPRMYVGGHYATDVLVGFALGTLGFIVARVGLEDRIRRRAEPLFADKIWRPVGEVLVFFVIWQLTVEFNEVIWMKRVLALLFR